MAHQVVFRTVRGVVARETFRDLPMVAVQAAATLRLPDVQARWLETVSFEIETI